MSRSFTNTILFESALDAIAPAKPVLYNISENIFRPLIKVTDDDCQTLLGKELPISFRVQGEVEASTGLQIDSARISTLITNGAKVVNVRSLDSCIAVGGICQKCISASKPRAVLPAIGFSFKVVPEIALDITQAVVLSGASTSKLTYSDIFYDSIYVYQNGALLSESSYSISGDVITLNSAVVSDTLLVCKYMINSNIAFYYWLAQTFSGSLLGIKPFPNAMLPLRKELFVNTIPEADVESLIFSLKTSSIGQEDSVQYLDSIKDKLERAVFATLLGSIFLTT